jgi:hypothetical protein
VPLFPVRVHSCPFVVSPPARSPGYHAVTLDRNHRGQGGVKSYEFRIMSCGGRQGTTGSDPDTDCDTDTDSHSFIREIREIRGPLPQSEGFSFPSPSVPPNRFRASRGLKDWERKEGSDAENAICAPSAFVSDAVRRVPTGVSMMVRNWLGACGRGESDPTHVGGYGVGGARTACPRVVRG